MNTENYTSMQGELCYFENYATVFEASPGPIKWSYHGTMWPRDPFIYICPTTLAEKDMLRFAVGRRNCKNSYRILWKGNICLASIALEAQCGPVLYSADVLQPGGL